MSKHVPGLEAFLESQQGRMRLRPHPDYATLIEGPFCFSATGPDEKIKRGSFELLIKIPVLYPRDLPVTEETGGVIPRTKKFHVNHDGSFCLTSPLRMLSTLKQNPCLLDFTIKYLIPFLYSISCLLEGTKLPFGDLKHGTPGLFQDYMELFGVDSEIGVRRFLECLAVKKRVANKLPCPCGCHRRLGNCSTRYRLNELRKVMPKRKILETEISRLG